jgi:hypothetical protein
VVPTAARVRLSVPACDSGGQRARNPVHAGKAASVSSSTQIQPMAIDLSMETHVDGRAPRRRMDCAQFKKVDENDADSSPAASVASRHHHDVCFT